MFKEKYADELMVAARHKSREREYWINKLSGEWVRSRFPDDETIMAAAGQTVSPAEPVRFKIPGAASLKIIKLSGNSDLRVFIILTAGLVLLLEKYTGNKDIVIGMPIFKEEKTGAGEFLNTVVALRNALEDNLSFKDLILQVRQTVVEAAENQDFPIELLPELLNIPSSGKGFPLADTAILLDNIHDKSNIDHIGINILFRFLRSGREIEGELHYNPVLYRKATIEIIAGRFIYLLENALIKPEEPIININILSEEDKRQLLWDFNHTKVEEPAYKTIHEGFAGQVEKTPDRTAAVFETEQITYSELNKKANRLARLLRKKGVGPDSIVGLIIERSLAMIMAIIGILKAGGAYQPIDPSTPQERILSILEDSRASVLITQEEVSRGIPLDFSSLRKLNTQMVDPLKTSPGAGHRYSLNNSLKTCPEAALEKASFDIIFWEQAAPEINRLPADNLDNINESSDLLYVIYTSGTTGKPKGVMLEHRNLLNLINHQYRLTIIDFSRVLQFITIGFDVSFQEIFSTLLSGGTLLLIRDEDRVNIRGLFAKVEKNQIRTLFLPASFVKFVLGEEDCLGLIPGCVRHIVTAGEQVVVGDRFAKYLRESGVYLHNHYGPAETHVVTALTLNPHEEIPRFPSIGKPITGTAIYILDKNYALLPIGAAGQLYIGGIQVGRGYLGDSRLTATVFLPNPFKKGERVYKTGDLARWLPGGNIEFLGRIDDQVKIRGFRIEPVEIEQRLLHHEGVLDVAVLALKDGKGEKFLCAYIVPRDAVSLSPAEMRTFLSRDLPDYMIPSYFIPIEKIPLTLNGKLDRKALPEPKTANNMKDYTPPRDESEKKLVELWSGVLNIDSKIGIDDNFFQLGGHSLKATILIAKIHKELNVDITLGEIFTNPTIREIAKLIKASARHGHESMAIAEEREYYPLTPAQKRLYILQQMNPAETAYNLPIIFRLEGKIEAAKLDEIFLELIQRHDSQRTSFHQGADEPVQVIRPRVEFKIEFYENRHTDVPGIVRAFVRPFDLSRAPLLRVGLINMNREEHVLMLDMHHIITDGTSLSILTKEVMALVAGTQLAPLPVRFKDYAQWLGREKQKQALKAQETYWLTEFAGEVPVLEMPLDYARPVVQDFEGHTVKFELEKEKTACLKEHAHQEGGTLFMVLLALVNILFAKLSGQEDIVIGTPIAGRRHASLEGIIGMFVNTLALRNYPAAGKGFKEFLSEVREKTLTAYDNQDYPFEELVRQVKTGRDAGGNPLFTVMFALANLDLPRVEIPGLKLAPYDFQYKKSHFDLSLTALEAGEKLIFSVEYRTRLFKLATIERFIGYFRKIIDAVSQDHQKKISDIEVLSAREKKQLLFDFNNTAAVYPAGKPLQALFEEQVEAVPDRVALVGQPLTHKKTNRNHNRSYLSHKSHRSYMTHISYKVLDEQSRALAHLLREKGMEPDTIVALMAERSIEVIIGILGILKAGGAYMPIDLEYPQERIDYMLKDSGAKILVSDRKNIGTIGREVVVFEINQKRLRGARNPAAAGGYNGSRKESPEPLAYIIYTSGSTGKPKGVLIDHTSVVNLALCQIERFDINNSDRVLQFSSICFDASVEQIFIALFTGAALVLVDKNTLLNNDTFESFIAIHLITHLHAVPSFLNQITLKRAYQLRRVIAGGDVCSISLASRWSTYCTFYNEYGPTETTVTSIEKEYKTMDAILPWLPIGQPLYNTVVYILDKWKALVPLRVVGEMYIGGVGIARGYLNNPELTAEKFIKPRIYTDLHGVIQGSLLPHSPTHQLFRSRIYRTGDLARWCLDGNIEFLGRIDQQVKIRGYRIELGEIENQLVKHQGIKEAVVVEKEDKDGEKFLCAYFAPGVGSSLAPEELKKYLVDKLPAYMIPSYYTQVEKIPLTTNGKVDRKALPEPGVAISAKYTAPVNAIERQLIEIWAQVLGRDAEHVTQLCSLISGDDNFFQLGGHSLKASMLVASIHKTMRIKVPLLEVFNRQTLRALADYIKGAQESRYTAIEAVEKKEYYRLSSAQKRLYVLHHMHARNIVYNVPALHVLKTGFDKVRFEEIIRQMMERHEGLRTSFIIINNESRQKVHPPHEAPIEIEYFKICQAEAREIVRTFIRPFDLSKLPLMRVGLVEVDDAGHYLLLLDMHHIITDAVSGTVFLNDFMSLYRGEELPPLKLQYKDYTERQNSVIQRSAIQRQKEYWLKQFSGDIPYLNMPTDYPRGGELSFKGSSFYFEIGRELTARVKDVVTRSHVTLSIFLLAAYTVLLSKYTGQEDILVGVPTAGRTHNDLQGIIGFFANMLPMRNHPAKEKTFGEFLEDVKKNSLDAYDNQDYQFDDMIRDLEIERRPGRQPLIDTVLALHDNEAPPAENPGLVPVPREERLHVHSYQFENEISHFDLLLNGAVLDDTIEIAIEYSTSLFKEATVVDISKGCLTVVEAVVENPGIKLGDIEITHGFLTARSDVLRDKSIEFEF